MECNRNINFFLFSLSIISSVISHFFFKIKLKFSRVIIYVIYLWNIYKWNYESFISLAFSFTFNFTRIHFIKSFSLYHTWELCFVLILARKNSSKLRYPFIIFCEPVINCSTQFDVVFQCYITFAFEGINASL